MAAETSPAQRDAHLQQLMVERSRCRTIVENAARTVEAGRPLTAHQRQREADARARLGELDAAIEEGELVYDRAPWTRFYLVADGKVHGSVRCSTCNNGQFATAFTWLTDDSGRTASAMIGEYGSAMCTVCFPAAPLDRRFGEFGVRNRATQDVKDAARRDRAAKAAAKDAATPRGDDGNPLRLSDGTTPSTERAARMVLAERLGNVHWYRLSNANQGHDRGHYQEPMWTADARAAARAVARLEGAEDVGARAEQIYADADAKALKRQKAQFRAALKTGR